MQSVAKYNTCKAISTLLTVGTPIITLCSCSELFIHRSETAISAAGIFALLLSSLFLKDKIAENFKIPSAFVLSLIGLILIVTIESIILPLKYVFVATVCATGLDEITFKRIYKRLELLFPENYKAYKTFGFIFAKTETLLGGTDAK